VSLATVDQLAIEILDHGVEAATMRLFGVRVHVVLRLISCGTVTPVASDSSMTLPIAAVVPIAGAGTCTKSSLPKVLHQVAGKAMQHHLPAGVARLQPLRIVSVVAPGDNRVVATFAPHPTAIQQRPLGTGDASRAALPALAGHAGPVLVVYAVSPSLTTESLNRLVQACQETRAGVGVLGFRARDSSPCGRLIVRDGALGRIVASKDASPAEKAIDFVSSGVMCLDDVLIGESLEAIRNDNVKSEEFQGVNSRGELALTERAFQNRLRAAAMAAGVTIADPDTDWPSAATQHSPDVTLGPDVRVGASVSVASNVRINAFCDIEGARIAEGAPGRQPTKEGRTATLRARLREQALAAKQARGK
jgi:bifunctional UDP-N-acetylglucosamine pyrophosphorylase/glucosamine-1-phosphate N-acetyltransferase